MNREKQTSTPPPIPRKRAKTMEIETSDMVEIVGIIEQARTLLKERLENAKVYFGKPVPYQPDQLKLGILIELGGMSSKEIDKVSEMLDREIRRAGIKR